MFNSVSKVLTVASFTCFKKKAKKTQQKVQPYFICKLENPERTQADAGRIHTVCNFSVFCLCGFFLNSLVSYHTPKKHAGELNWED